MTRPEHLDPAAGAAELGAVDPSCTTGRPSAPPPPCHDDPDLFFSHARRKIAAAKQLCTACPLRQPCLELSLVTAERHGIWGGLTEDERRPLRPRRGSPARSAA
jgi:WhiB family redox-sensing transcriptional regulator